jgi:hypothetical protein
VVPQALGMNVEMVPGEVGDLEHIKTIFCKVKKYVLVLHLLNSFERWLLCFRAHFFLKYKTKKYFLVFHLQFFFIADAHVKYFWAIIKGHASHVKTFSHNSIAVFYLHPARAL